VEARLQRCRKALAGVCRAVKQPWRTVRFPDERRKEKGPETVVSGPEGSTVQNVTMLVAVQEAQLPSQMLSVLLMRLFLNVSVLLELSLRNATSRTLVN
jgi:hypothetical protein